MPENSSGDDEQDLLLDICSFTSWTGKNYTMVCPPVRGDNSRALASGLSPVQAGKP